MNDEAAKIHNAASRFILSFEVFYGLEGRRGISATYRMAQMEGFHLLLSPVLA